VGKKTEARRRGRERAAALMKAIDDTAATLTTQELRGFLQRISRGVYERRRPLYPRGLHPNQKR